MSTHVARSRRGAAWASALLVLCFASVPRIAARAAAPRPDGPPPTDARTTATISDALPLAFEPNVGQTDARVRFVARGHAYTTFLADDGATLSIPSARASVRLTMAGAKADTHAVAVTPLPGRTNYLVGAPDAWRTDVPTYASVRYEGVYEGIDAVFYGDQSRLEYDLVVAPGADASAVRLKFEGQTSARVDEDGGLTLALPGGGELRQQRALAYQEGAAGKRTVAARYAASADGEVRLELGDYDRTRPLVVDPTLTYVDFLGGGASRDMASAITVDSAGNAYVTGMTDARNFPVTPGAYDTTPPVVTGGSPLDIFVAKLNPQGTALVFATYLGGTGLDDSRAIAVDASGNVHVAGITESPDFPTTAGAFDRTFSTAPDAFVSELSVTGASLVHSTFLGGAGADEVHAMRIASNGGPIVVGSTTSNNFPTTAGAFDTTFDPQSADAFVTRLSPDYGFLTFSTFVGGSGSDTANGVALDASGNVYVAGSTTSANFPTTVGAYDTTYGSPSTDAFALKLLASGSALSYSTFLGGPSYEVATAVAVDASGNAVVVGQTSSAAFPVTPGVYTTGAPDSNGSGFVTKFNASGTGLVYSTAIGGNSDDYFASVALDAAGDAYVAGRTDSLFFPTTTGAFDTTIVGDEGLALELNASASALVFSTFLGGSDGDTVTGIAVDGSGRAYVAGWSYSFDFPTTPGALDTTPNGATDAFVVRIDAGGGAGYSTLLAGTASDVVTEFDTARAVAVDPAGATYVAGATGALTFPTTPGAFDTTFGLDMFGDVASEAFVSKISPGGTTLQYSTLLGGGAADVAYGIAVGLDGAAYVVGTTEAFDFPTTPGAFDRTYGGNTVGTGDGFVAKLAPNGGSLVYSTFLGSDYDDEARAVALGADGTAYVTGTTDSPTFPTTPGAFDTVFGSDPRVADAFLTRVSADGSSLAYSTFLGGTDEDFGNGVAVDASGNAYVVGETRAADFPTTSGAFDTVFAADDFDVNDGFVTKVAPAGDALVYSSFLGGAKYDLASAVAVDASGAAYVVGTTSSVNFPVTPGAYDTTYAGDQFSATTDGFVAKVAPSGTALDYATYLGGTSAESCYGVAVTAAGAAYVTGTTVSADFPTTPDAVDRVLDSGVPGAPFGDAFVTGIAPGGGSLAYSTFLGGSMQEIGWGVARTADGSIVVVGESLSRDFAPSGFGQHDAYNAWIARFRISGAGGDTVGVYVPGTGAWFLRNANSPGAADTVFVYGPAGAGWIPLHGDWNGDGVDTPGVYDPATGNFFLKNTSGPGAADLVFSFGVGGAGYVPVAGDWNGDGVDTVGIYVPATGVFFLRNTNTPGNADVVFTFGAGGAGYVPLAGDWNGDGTDTVGLYVPATGAFFLRNANASGNADLVFIYGPPNATPVTGDFDGDGDDTIGVYSAATGTFFLKNTNAPGNADLAFAYGPAGATPLAGDWDGQ